jgi:hypothetical protein
MCKWCFLVQTFKIYLKNHLEKAYEKSVLFIDYSSVDMRIC